MQNKGQQLRTTSSTKNEFKHRESHQGTKNNTIHKDRITNQRPKPNRRRKTINEQKEERTNHQNNNQEFKDFEQDQEQRNRHKLNTTEPKDKRQQQL